jgi:glutamyl-tRNA reductase
LILGIEMVGIDHEKANISCRELFSFTPSKSQAAMEAICAHQEVLGCVLLSTCNRTELYVDLAEGEKTISALELLCEQKGVDPAEYAQFFTLRQGEDGVHHLFRLACGMQSRIFGEDQIITQVKGALQNARECGCADTVLETLFRMAVTYAKKVKTQMRLTGMDSSAATSMVELLSKSGPLQGKKALVIGNGEMGRLSARALVEAGCDVCMTLRQYRRGDVLIPQGCDVVHYDHRLQKAKEADIIVSATASPHYTLHAEESEFHPGAILVDLAVPRDIDSKIGSWPHVTLYGIDDLQLPKENSPKAQLEQEAEEILRQGMEEFYQWRDFREHIETIQKISRETAGYICRRMEKQLPPEELSRLHKISKQAVARLMFGLKDNLDKELWGDCLEALLQASKEEA